MGFPWAASGSAWAKWQSPLIMLLLAQRKEDDMSWQAAEEPEVKPLPVCRALEAVIEPRPRDLGGFEVRRVLPSARRRSVGSFVFFDQMGPAELAPGMGIDV